MILAKLSAADDLVYAVPIGPRGTGITSASTNFPTYNNGPSKRGKVRVAPRMNIPLHPTRPGADPMGNTILKLPSEPPYAAS